MSRWMARPEMAPRGPKIAPRRFKMAQDGLNRSYVNKASFYIALVGLWEEAQEVPRWTQDGPGRPRNGSKRPQDGPRRLITVIVHGKLVHQYAPVAPLHQYTAKAVHRYIGAPVAPV